MVSILTAVLLILLALVVGGTAIFLCGVFIPQFIAKPTRYLNRMEKKLQAEVDKLTGKEKEAAQSALKSVQDLQSKI